MTKTTRDAFENLARGHETVDSSIVLNILMHLDTLMVDWAESQKDLHAAEQHIKDLMEAFKQINVLAGRPTREGRSKIQEICHHIIHGGQGAE